jgi:26S proteasome regulatory subunit N8
MNHQILYQLQDVFNLLPNLSIEEFSRSFAVKTNDQLLVVYIASLIRSVIALDNLIGNKLSISEAERKEVEKKKEDLQKSKKAEGEESSKGKGKEGEAEGKDGAADKGTSPKK